MDDLDLHWAETEARIRAVLDSVSTGLSGEDKQQVSEFLRANELGLALQWLAYALFEEGVAVEVSTRDEILSIGHSMGTSQDLPPLSVH